MRLSTGRFACLLAVVMVVSVVGTLVAMEPPTAPAAPAAPAPLLAPDGVPLDLADDFDAMIHELKLNGAQLAKQRELMAARKVWLNGWNESEKGKRQVELRKLIADARKANDAAKVEELSKENAAINAEHWEARNAWRGKITANLSFEQQKTWAGVQLWRNLTRHFNRARLTAEQVAKAKAICAPIGAAAITAETVKTDPYFSAALGAVRADAIAKITEILDDEQKARIAPKPAPAPAPAPAEPAAAAPAPILFPQLMLDQEGNLLFPEGFFIGC